MQVMIGVMRFSWSNDCDGGSSKNRRDSASIKISIDRKPFNVHIPSPYAIKRFAKVINKAPSRSSRATPLHFPLFFDYCMHTLLISGRSDERSREPESTATR